MKGVAGAKNRAVLRCGAFYPKRAWKETLFPQRQSGRLDGAARLPRIEVRKPATVIGRTTVGATFNNSANSWTMTGSGQSNTNNFNASGESCMSLQLFSGDVNAGVNEAPLQQMVDSIEAGHIGRFLAFDTLGLPVQFD